jgi:hypothetical protein
MCQREQVCRPDKVGLELTTVFIGFNHQVSLHVPQEIKLTSSYNEFCKSWHSISWPALIVSLHHHMAVLGNRSLAYEPFVQDETVSYTSRSRTEVSGYHSKSVVGLGGMLKYHCQHSLAV